LSTHIELLSPKSTGFKRPLAIFGLLHLLWAAMRAAEGSSAKETPAAKKFVGRVALPGKLATRFE